MIRIGLMSVAYFVISAALLFGSAGTWRWPQAWAYLAVQVMFVAVAVCRGDRRMLELRSSREPDAKRWDVWMAPVSASFFWLIPMVFAGLDTGRWHLSPPLPFWITITAFVLHAGGLGLSAWAMITNRFFSKVVAIMPRRDHHVVSGGPYSHVRHPGYSGALVAFGVLPIALGSVWALIPAALGLGLLVLRTAWEDQTLRRELPGYEDYAARVRWRLMPGVW